MHFTATVLPDRVLVESHLLQPRQWLQREDRPGDRAFLTASHAITSNDASTRRNEEIGKVQRYLVTEIQAYANAQGFDLVLGEGVFFAKGPLDITANVLAVLATKPTTLPATAPPGKGATGTAPAPAKTPGGK